MSTILPIIKECNQNCLFCAAKERNDNVSLKHIYQEINRAKSSITISGGEPTLSKNLFIILKYAKDKKLNIELQTNGVTLSYFNLAKKLAQEKIGLFNINFPSHLEKLNDQITQTRGLFPKRIAGIHNLEKLNAQIRITHIINSLNYSHVGEMVDFIKNNFKCIYYIQFSFIKVLGNAKKIPWVVPKHQRVKKTLLKALQKCQEYGIRALVDHIPTCYLPGYEEQQADFEKLKIGERAEFSLEEKIKLKECQKCTLKEYCYGVRKDYLELFGQKNTKVVPYCNPTVSAFDK